MITVHRIYVHLPRRTLQKIHMCLKALREAGTLKRLFRKSEIAAQLDSCERELRAASEIFTVGPHEHERTQSEVCLHR
jgi:hypothetical protein